MGTQRDEGEQWKTRVNAGKVKEVGFQRGTSEQLDPGSWKPGRVEGAVAGVQLAGRCN